MPRTPKPQKQNPLNQTKTMAKTIRNKHSHTSVTAMVREHLKDDPGFLKELTAHLDERKVAKTLAILRARANLSQKELAFKADCKQPRISKLESGKDVDIRFGDIIAYLKATDHDVRIFFVPKGQTIAEDLKMHANQIHRLLNRLVQFADDDASIAKGVAAFIDEAHRNLARLAQLAADSLPATEKQHERMVEVESPQITRNEERSLLSDLATNRDV